MQRRRLLKLGLASATLLALAGGTLAVLRPGLHASRLSPAGREVFTALAPAMLEGSLPTAPSQRDQAIIAMLDRIDTLVAALPAHAQSELSQLLALLSNAAGRRALAVLDPEWPNASVAEIQHSLQAMRLSSVSLRQQAYHALHDIISGAYFAEPATWPILGYPGPVTI
jgi:hypothetical protein